MLSRVVVVVVGILLALASAAEAAALRVSAEPPLSAQRLGDTLRSYLDGAEVTVAPAEGAGQAGEGLPAEAGMVSITLRGSRGLGEDAELVLVDGDETILARLPGALRTEDLYRTAALKVQALLQRRAATGTVLRPTEATSEARASSPPQARDRLWLDAGLAMMVPATGPSREGLRLGSGLRLSQRWRVALGAYLEPPQSQSSQGIDIKAWELPLWLSLGCAWHQGRWQGFLDAVGHAAIRRISAEGNGIVSNADTALSPRAGPALGFGVALGPGLRAAARVSLLAALVDTRYRVDGQVVWPAARVLLLAELGIEYGVR
jgi:hypothetical protein